MNYFYTMPRKITRIDVEALAIGGTILGGGGGGRPEFGLAAGRLALELGGVELWSPEEAPPEWKVITIASLGAPTQRGDTKYRHFIRAVQMLREAGVDFDGVIAAENGGYNSFGGWIPAAALGLPVVDAPGDGRAHPTSMMGSMGMHRIDYKSVKAGVTEGAETGCLGVGTRRKGRTASRGRYCTTRGVDRPPIAQITQIWGDSDDRR